MKKEKGGGWACSTIVFYGVEGFGGGSCGVTTMEIINAG